jgi:hypothetical protein
MSAIEAVIEDAVQPVDFVAEPAKRVRLIPLLVAEAEKMTELACLRALVCHLPKDPLDNLVPQAQVLRPELPRLLGEVKEDRARLEDGDRLAAARRVVVHQDGHPVVRVQREVTRLELIAPPDVARHDAVLEARLFKEDRDLFAIGRGPKVQVQHRLSSWCGL